MDNCLFCKIIKGEIPCEKIYEDDSVIAFLDIRPTTNGDTLIVPKKHYKDFLEADQETFNYMHDVIKKLYPIYQEKLHCKGLTLTHNTDYGQEIKHLHIHFIPRYENDQINYLSNKEILKSNNEIQDILTK